MSQHFKNQFFIFFLLFFSTYFSYSSEQDLGLISYVHWTLIRDRIAENEISPGLTSVRTLLVVHMLVNKKIFI